jgi:hypothetical protein
MEPRTPFPFAPIDFMFTQNDGITVIIIDILPLAALDIKNSSPKQ